MAAQEEVTLVIRARDRTRAAWRSIRRNGQRAIGIVARLGGAVAALAGGALISAARRFEDIANAARLLGVSVEELQGLQILGRRFGIDAATMVDLLDEIRARAGEAVLEGGEAAEAFERLGFTAQDLRGTPVQILERLSDALADSTLNANELAATLDQIGSDPARQLLPLLRGGNLRGRIQEVRPLTATPEAVETGAEATRRTAETLTVASNRFADAANAFIPVLRESFANNPIGLGSRALELLEEIRRNTGEGDTLR